ncbi:NEL-type E3 ubiquitin ligase domain-containing protein [Pseudomonas sp. NPDC089401]|uniref:NEL-type E3 ubiquitin ligase domain-containing protein n=1 Tax=Pseudomonas sp. NPDC089401 TaxID=3364462 RepID=UPI0038266E74
MNTHAASTVVGNDPLALEQAYQDQLIANCLPAWMRQADMQHMTRLGDALKRCVAARQRLSAQLSRLQGLDGFVAARLHAALAERFGVTTDVGTLQFLDSFRKPLFSYAPVRVPMTTAEYYPMPLLEAALHNFSADQTRLGGQPPGHCVRDANAAILARPSALQFAQLCRELDLGAAYQQYLDGALAPCVSPLLQVLTERMLFDACKARLEGVLDEDELQMVIGLCRNGRPGRLKGARVIASQLHLSGCTLQQIVVLEVRDERLAPLYSITRQVLVYIPGDPMGPWSRGDDLAKFTRKVLGSRLRQQDYQAFFQRFVLRRDCPRFFSRVVSGYHDLPAWAGLDLGETLQAYDLPLFPSLAAATIAQIKLDAATIAMPVRQLDRKVQAEHRQMLATQALTLLGIAGLFVPMIGVGLLAVTAFELLKETYQGLTTWRAGDVDAAADHFRHVAVGVAGLAAVGAGVTLAQRAWSGAPVVDALVPTQLEDGSLRLWNADPAPFRSLALPAEAIRDEQGIYRLDDRTWIEMEGHPYLVRYDQSLERWRLHAEQGHAPLLHHNGAGAWRLACEQPAQWHDARRMFRRFGGTFAELDDQRIEQVLAIHALDADQLRAWHVHDTVPEAAVADTVERARLVARIDVLLARLQAGQAPLDRLLLEQAGELPGAAGLNGNALAEVAQAHRRLLFERLYQSQQRPDSDQAALRRLFPSLHPRAARALLLAASAADRERLQRTGRVPLCLAEAARASARYIRLVRVMEALQFDTAQTLDLARVTVQLLSKLPGSRQWRVVEANGLDPAQGPQPARLAFSDGQFVVFDDSGQVVQGPGELFQVLADAADPAQRAAMGQDGSSANALRQAVRRLATEHRDDVTQVLQSDTARTWFNAPRRLASGRVGYPLSGRGSGQPQRHLPRALQARLRALYPEYNDEQLRSWIRNAPASLRATEQLLGRLEGQLATLNRHLRTWVHQARNAEQQENRRFFRQALRNCWQRRSDGPEATQVFNSDYRWSVYGARPGALPGLPDTVRFEHVFVLSLRGMLIPEIPESFLAAFPNLRVLELPGNRLRRVPQTVLQMRHLQCLDLFDNAITLDPGQSTILASCERLLYLNVSNNPLGRLFSLEGLTQLNELHLSSTRVAQLPRGLLDHAALRRVDLRGNLITELPEEFFRSRIWREGDVQLRGNPFTEAQTARLRRALRAVATPAQHTAAVPIRLRWLDAITLQQREEMGACWDELEYLEGSSDFFRLLGRLLETADFQHRTGARYLAHRVLNMLQAMRRDVVLRGELFDNASQLTCQDSVALRFTDLELRLMAWQAEADALRGDRQQALLRLGRQLWRLEQVDRIALEDIQSRLASEPTLDQLEVLLGYRLALRDALDLPVRTNSMTFVRLADVQPSHITRATAQVLEAETGQALAESMVERDFWRTHLQTTFSARFTALGEPYHARLEALQDDHVRAEAERIEQMNEVMHEQQIAERGLLLQLTLEALDNGGPETAIWVR